LTQTAPVRAGGDSDKPKAGPIAVAIPVQQPPRLDGDVLNDPVWAEAPPVTRFWQTRPKEGEPASERTEVRIVYTAEAIYFGVICYDRNPQSIIVADSRRDASLEETDSFQIILDTYHDQQNGFVFGTNPAGIEYDGQVTNEGLGTGFGARRQRGGSGGGFNINWDGSWEVRTKISEIGWSAEFAIPFRTLRYAKGTSQTWGLNFQRNIRRRKETSFWAPLPRQFNLYRLSQAGQLTGLKIRNQRNLKLTPYVLGQARRDLARKRPTEWLGDAGIDLKYSLTPSLTLDATYNTDFAQVEVDEQQINLDRFNLFFPEKRPFFLENAGLFAVGSPGEVELFFSRRIGIGPNGTAVPIVGGARLSGKISKTNIGLLNMQTEAVAELTQANNFTVVRVSQELPNRSALGAIFVNRQGTGELASENDFNRTVAVDGRWGIGKYGQISGFAARTWTPGMAGPQHAVKLSGRYDSEGWLLMAAYTEVADRFNPEVGFLRRKGFRKPEFLIFHRFRPQSFLGLQELRPHVSYRGFWHFDGFQETGYLHIDNHWEWKNGYEVHTGINFTREGVSRPFEIFPGVVVPIGTYDHTEAQIVAFTNQGAWASLRVRANIGGFFGGDRVSFTATAKMRVGETFNTEFSLNRNDIHLPGGRFVTNLARMRISYSFTPRIFLQALLQYNDRADIWSTNVRFAWLHAANTGLFVVFNETRDLEDLGFPARDRNLIVKISQLFDLLN
jgi:hypothetical protein